MTQNYFVPYILYCHIEIHCSSGLYFAQLHMFLLLTIVQLSSGYDLKTKYRQFPLRLNTDLRINKHHVLIFLITKKSVWRRLNKYLIDHTVKELTYAVTTKICTGVFTVGTWSDS